MGFTAWNIIPASFQTTVECWSLCSSGILEDLRSHCSGCWLRHKKLRIQAMHLTLSPSPSHARSACFKTWHTHSSCTVSWCLVHQVPFWRSPWTLQSHPVFYQKGDPWLVRGSFLVKLPALKSWMYTILLPLTSLLVFLFVFKLFSNLYLLFLN